MIVSEHCDVDMCIINSHDVMTITCKLMGIS